MSLCIAFTPPTDCGYLPIAKVQLTTDGIGLPDRAPVLNVKQDDFIMRKLENAMALIQNKFENGQTGN